MENPLIPVRNPDKNSTERFNIRGENSSEKGITFRGIIFLPLLRKRAKMSAPFVWIIPGFLSRESKKFSGIL